jgi:hypothetical protein
MDSLGIGLGSNGTNSSSSVLGVVGGSGGVSGLGGQGSDGHGGLCLQDLVNSHHHQGDLLHLHQIHHQVRFLNFLSLSLS